MTDQRLRKDAERNRQKLIDAGRALLAERGMDTTLNEIAHHAGVGVGTAYRRFPHKQALFDAIFEQQISDLELVLHDSLANPDAWAGVVDYLERSLALQADDLGMAQVLSGRRVRPEQHDWERDRLAPLVNELIAKAQAQGVVRSDASGTDLVFIQIGLIAVAEAVRTTDSPLIRSDVHALHRRYLWLMLDALRVHPHEASALPIAALTTDETHRLLAQRSSLSGE
ncbi:TetR/AcrR family transcriptional regulator [Clavibacter zhangzhiyongii]|uniref:TetR/AcrR family transcriptional regulator n=1 Tax=Clavibacter zhangzhiyongii TaxID=2768071 RepID=UPI0039E0D320